MHFSFLNLFSALAIGLVISGMALIKNTRSKALLYVLPIPISIGLIATHGKVSSSNLIGLGLIWVFMYLVLLFVNKVRLPVIAADCVAALCYIALGYAANKLIHWPFLMTVIVFLIVWAAIVAWMHRHPISDKPHKPSTVSPAAKGSIAAVVSFCIYSVQHLLAGVVVTFPYNGIFAVVEVSHNLAVFSRAVIRNTLAIGALFITMYYLQAFLPVGLNLAAGWVSFGIVLSCVRLISV